MQHVKMQYLNQQGCTNIICSYFSLLWLQNTNQVKVLHCHIKPAPVTVIKAFIILRINECINDKKSDICAFGYESKAHETIKVGGRHMVLVAVGS